MDLHVTIADIWFEILGRRPGPGSAFLHDGGSSVQLMSFQLEVQRRTGVLIDVDELTPPFTFTDLLLAAEGAMADVRNDPRADRFADTGRSILRGPVSEKPRTLTDQVRRVAEEVPNAVAMRCGDAVLTYGELVERASELGRRLRPLTAAGTGVVVIAVPPGIEYGIAVLGAILGRGFAAPLHPEFPSARVRRIIELADPVAIVTDLGSSRPHADVVDADPRTLAVILESPRTDDSPLLTTLDDPCYALFTSGSTGIPKGVLMHQLPVANLARFEADRTPTPMRTAQFAPLGFDVAFQEMFGTWASGGELVVVPPEARRNPARLVRFLASARIERFHCVPLLLRLLARASNQLEMPLETLQEIITAGEALRIDDDIRNFGKRCGRLRISNQFGLAETIQVTHVDLGSDPDAWPDVPELGSPIDGVDVRVIDESGRPVGHGMEGNVEVGGFAPALGYLGIDSPRFRTDDDGRWYDTGDRAVMHSDGRLEFRGRMDDQVKINGYRVELGEVAKALVGLEEVVDVAVVTLAAGDGTTMLGAMIVPAGVADADRIRMRIREQLPEWMVPQRIEFDEALPMSGNNKIDRGAVRARLLSPPAMSPTS